MYRPSIARTSGGRCAIYVVCLTKLALGGCEDPAGPAVVVRGLLDVVCVLNYEASANQVQQMIRIPTITSLIYPIFPFVCPSSFSARRRVSSRFPAGPIPLSWQGNSFPPSSLHSDFVYLPALSPPPSCSWSLRSSTVVIAFVVRWHLTVLVVAPATRVRLSLPLVSSTSLVLSLISDLSGIRTQQPAAFT